jgi:hypothetical protein
LDRLIIVAPPARCSAGHARTGSSIPCFQKYECERLHICLKRLVDRVGFVVDDTRIDDTAPVAARLSVLRLLLGVDLDFAADIARGRPPLSNMISNALARTVSPHSCRAASMRW